MPPRVDDNSFWIDICGLLFGLVMALTPL